MKTRGISHKVLADLLVSVVSFALTYFAADLDPATAAIISKLVGSIAGVLAPPNEVTYNALPGGGAPPTAD